ncbi:MAG TPA: thioredoxin domain-containing protein [Terriglobia bacterium]|nr:thioredoxin domain-containing protein [Terriglobia bacterium]
MGNWKKIQWFLAGVLVFAGGFLVVTRQLQPAPAKSDTAIRQKIAGYVRAKFGLMDTVKLTVDPLEDSGHGGFYKSAVTSEDGKQTKTHNIILSGDERYMVLGEFFPLGSDPKNEIASRVRETFKIPPATIVSVSDFRRGPIPNLLAITITAQNGNQKQVQDFFVTSDKSVLLLGSLFNLTSDPRLEVLRTLTTDNQPSVGPANAPVTLVEFSDLQCASCSHMHKFIEDELLPKYGNKVRIVFKEFPLATIHDWSLTGSIACQCVYQIKPSAYMTYRSLIFRNQASFNATNARSLLIDYGEQAGIDRLQLAACIDSKASLPRIQQSLREGQAVGVQSTPTTFVNGRMVVGLPSPDAVFKVINEALRAAR